jgi:hypothetical protein
MTSARGSIEKEQSAVCAMGKTKEGRLMHARHYIRNLMIERISGERARAEADWSPAAGSLEGDNDRRRFRGMAEKRKRQILERMLLDDSAGETGGGERRWANHA